jgi:hypothetical protein
VFESRFVESGSNIVDQVVELGPVNLSDFRGNRTEDKKHLTGRNKEETNEISLYQFSKMGH